MPYWLRVPGSLPRWGIVPGPGVQPHQFPGLALTRAQRKPAGPVQSKLVRLGILPVAPRRQPQETSTFCRGSTALPNMPSFAIHAPCSLAKGLSVHISAGLLGEVFSARGILSQDRMAVPSVCRNESRAKGARNLVSSQESLCSSVNKP